MFFKILNKIRQKPEASRELIALGASMGICAIIAIGWAIYFIPHAGQVLKNTSSADIVGPFSKVADFAANNTPQAPSFVTGTSSDFFASSTEEEASSTEASTSSSTLQNTLKNSPKSAGTSSKNLIQ